MKMKLYYVVEDSGFDDVVDYIMLAGPFGTYEQAEDVKWQDRYLGFSKVVEQVIDVN